MIRLALKQEQRPGVSRVVGCCHVGCLSQMRSFKLIQRGKTVPRGSINLVSRPITTSCPDGPHVEGPFHVVPA